MRGSDHLEQRVRRAHPVQDPIRVEDLVPTMLGVRLGEHRELDIRRISPEPREKLDEILDFVRRQREAEHPVGVLERRAPAVQDPDVLERTRRDVVEQCLRGLDRIEHAFGHAIVEERHCRVAQARL